MSKKKRMGNLANQKSYQLFNRGEEIHGKSTNLFLKSINNVIYAKKSAF